MKNLRCIIVKMNLSLAQAFRINSSACIAFIGSGGKTTAMFQLARQLPSPVIVTATSHLGAWQLNLADQHIIAETSHSLDKLEHGLQRVIVVTDAIKGDRTKPVNRDVLNWLHIYCRDHS